MSQTTVSIPAHLRSTLEPLPHILPKELRLQLLPYLAESSNEIPHLILSEIAKWARTDTARAQLRAKGLEPSQYSIISLLAGTITSPSSQLPPYVPPDDASIASKRAAEDRRALTAIVNALLSIGGAGYAAWWASSHSGWRDELRISLALLVALVLAISESILYLIWHSRREMSRQQRAHSRMRRAEKKDDGSDEAQTSDDNGEGAASRLRKRKPRALDE